MYAQVTKMLGNCYLEARCFNKTSESFETINQLCHIRGSMHKKEWIFKNDIILVSKRGYQDYKTDVIQRFTFKESLYLIKIGQLPDGNHKNKLKSFI